MFALAPFALVALALSVSAAPIPKRATAPTGWATDYLESYDVYHARYDALSCQTQHDTTFFDDCCHPLLATETLAGNRAAYCTPGSSSLVAASSTVAPTTTAAAPAATSSAADEDEGECEEETSSSAAPAAATTTSAAEVAANVVAPTTTAEKTTAWVAPTTTKKAETTKAAKTTTTKAAPAATTTAASSSSSTNTGGYATYFMQNGNPGACGNYNSDSTPLVAVPYKWWGTSDSQKSDLCGKYVNIERVSDGAKVTAIIADLCPTCTTDNSLDLSEGAFKSIATESEGMVEIKWTLA